MKAKSMKAEALIEMRPFVRVATHDDIDRLVEIDLLCFDDVYGDQPPTSEDVHVMLTDRLNAAGELMVVGEVGGQVEGFMTCQITDKGPEDFITWEETTDNGHITGTHNPDGSSLYIVNMTVTPVGSEAGIGDMLIANMYGRFIERRKDSAQLLSRIPQFSKWLLEQEVEFSGLTEAEQDALAEDYIHATKPGKNGKPILYDGMLRRYGYAGAKPVKVIRNGFPDPVSHDYGVLCVVENPLGRARHNRVAASLAGKAIKYLSQKPTIVQKIF